MSRQESYGAFAPPTVQAVPFSTSAHTAKTHRDTSAQHDPSGAARILETDPKVLRAPETALAASIPAPVALPDEATSARPRCSHGQRQGGSGLCSQRVPAATQHHAAPFRSSISHPGHATLLALPALRKFMQRQHHPHGLRVYLLLPPQRAVVATVPDCRPQGYGCCSIRRAGELC